MVGNWLGNSNDRVGVCFLIQKLFRVAKSGNGPIRKHTKWVGSYTSLLPNDTLKIGAGRFVNEVGNCSEMAL